MTPVLAASMLSCSWYIPQLKGRKKPERGRGICPPSFSHLRPCSVTLVLRVLGCPSSRHQFRDQTRTEHRTTGGRQAPPTYLISLSVFWHDKAAGASRCVNLHAYAATAHKTKWNLHVIISQSVCRRNISLNFLVSLVVVFSSSIDPYIIFPSHLLGIRRGRGWGTYSS